MKLKLLFLFALFTCSLFSQQLIKYKNTNSVKKLSINSINSTYSVSYIDRIEIRNQSDNSIVTTITIEQLNTLYGTGTSLSDDEGNIWISFDDKFFQFDGSNLTLIDSLNGESIGSPTRLEVTSVGKVIAFFSNFIGVYDNGEWIFSNQNTVNSFLTIDKETYVFWDSSSGNDLVIFSGNVFTKVATNTNIQNVEIATNNDVYFVGQDLSDGQVKYGKISHTSLTLELLNFPSSMQSRIDNMKIIGNYMYLNTINVPGNGLSGVYAFDMIDSSKNGYYLLGPDITISEVFLIDGNDRLLFTTFDWNTLEFDVVRISYDGTNFNSLTINLPDLFATSFKFIGSDLYYLTSSGFDLKYINSSNIINTEATYPYIIKGFEGYNSEIWLETSNGLIRRKDGVNTLLTSESDLPPFANALAKDSNNNVYVAGFSGISMFDGAIWQDVNLPNSIENQTIIDLLFDSNDDMWFVTNISLYRFSSGALTEYPYPNFYNGVNHQNFSYDGTNLFLGSFDNIIKYNIKDDVWNPIEKNGATLQIWNIISDSNNRTWLASRSFGSGNGGLFEIQGNSIVRVDNPFIDEGANHERLRYIAEDNDGRLWLGYIQGISTFDGADFFDYFEFSTIPSSPNGAPFIRKMNFVDGVLYTPFSFDGLFSFQNSEFTKIFDYAQDFRAVPASSIEVNGELWFSHFSNGIISRVQNLTLDVNEYEFSQTDLTIFPNPVEEDGIINFSQHYTDVVYKIFSLDGEKISSGKIKNANYIKIPKLTKGVYILKLKSNDLAHSLKVIVK